jgi:uncharacterized membrane-anchored protein YhcB (DUF1043 family)
LYESQKKLEETRNNINESQKKFEETRRDLTHSLNKSASLPVRSLSFVDTTPS